MNTAIDWKIDSLQDVLALVVIALFALLVIMRMLTMISKGELSIKNLKCIVSKKERVAKQERRSYDDLPCTSHTAMLTVLTDNQRVIRDELSGSDQMLRAATSALEVLLGLAKGEKINGQVDAARLDLASARGFQAGKKDGPT